MDIILRRHDEWREHNLRWRWMLDSLEGGERYRQAIYGYDHRGLPVRNLIRHKREYPDPREAGASFNGALVTGDAAFTTSPVAQAIRDRGGHYFLFVKGNQPELQSELQRAFGDLSPCVDRRRGAGTISRKAA